MDGVLDEEAWKNALVLELAYEIDPGENTPAPVKTERFQALKSDTRYPNPVADEFNQPTGPFGDPAYFLRYIHVSRDWFWMSNY